MLALLSSSSRTGGPATHRQMLSLGDLDDHLLRDIGLRRIDLHAVPAQRLLPAAAQGPVAGTSFVDRVRDGFAPRPASCC